MAPRIFQPPGIPHRPRCRQDAREQVRLMGGPHGEQASQRIAGQQTPRRGAGEQPFDAGHHLARQQAQPLSSLPGKVVVTRDDGLDGPRRQFLVPVQTADGHQVESLAPHLAACLQQQLPILMIINRVEQGHAAFFEPIQAHATMTEIYFLLFHCHKITIFSLPLPP